MSGPLSHLNLIEFSGIGPAPYAGMLLADLGARVIRVDRPGGGLFNQDPQFDYLNRNKPCIGVNLKTPEGLAVAKRLVGQADGLIEGFRPGVMEKLGLGPEVCLALNSRLVYGRMTGWGQSGPLSQTAGHDINYIGLSGALHAIGLKGQKPTLPLNLLGDFAGGGMMFAFGLLSGITQAIHSGGGQVVDAAMLDGSLHLMSSHFASWEAGFWKAERGSNLLDSGAPFYDTYETADGQYVAVGAIESKFYQQLLQGLGLDREDLPHQMDMAQWPELKSLFTSVFLKKSREEWLAIFDGTDACVTPVLAMSEVGNHPHVQARRGLLDVNGRAHPAPVPRFSLTPGAIERPASAVGQDSWDILANAGYSHGEIEDLLASGAVIDERKS